MVREAKRRGGGRGVIISELTAFLPYLRSGRYHLGNERSIAFFYFYGSVANSSEKFLKDSLTSPGFPIELSG